VKWIEISKIGIAVDKLHLLPSWAKKLANFDPLTKKFCCLTSTYPKSTVRVLCILTHLTWGHVTLLPGEFHFVEISPHSDLRRRADSRPALTQISLFYFFILCFLFLKLDSGPRSKMGEGQFIPERNLALPNL